MFFLKGFATKSSYGVGFLEAIDSSASPVFLRDADFYTRKYFAT